MIPTLNQGRFLSKCLDSILTQNYENIEIILIDGGSSDHTLSIINEYQSNFKYWVSEKDEGQSDALNKGFMHCSGDIVSWLNSDDFYLPNAFNELIKIYAKNPEAPFYFGDGIRVNEEGEKISNFFPSNSQSFNRKGFAFGLNYILQPSSFINHKKLKEVNYLDTNLKYGMDSDLWLKLSALGEPLPINALLSASREYGLTKTALGTFERIEELRIIAKKHTGLGMTPGVLCYFLDELYNYTKNNKEFFACNFEDDVIDFWKKTREAFKKYDLRYDGFPHSKILTIGIDMRQIVYGVSGGITQLTKGLLEEIFLNFQDYKFIVFCTPFNRGLIDYDGDNVSFKELYPQSFISQMDSILVSEKADLLFRTYPREDDLKFPMNRQIILIPDNQHDIYPNFFSESAIETRTAAFGKSLGEAAAIATISKFSLTELKRLPKTKVEDFFLVEPALNFSNLRQMKFDDLTLAEKEQIPNGEFFLYPANLWKHKNHNNVLKAFRFFLEKYNKKVEFIFTGNLDGWDELLVEYSDLPIRHLGYIRPEFLKILFERANALVFFSLYEGFGIPLLEAFHAELPVICSNTTSLPEVGGDAVLSCSPLDIQSMAQLMNLVITDKVLVNKLVKNGKSRLENYTWKKSAESLIEAFVRVGAKASPEEILSAHPLVTIVTPSYNQGNFLKRTIESVLNQDYKNIEYIVIDGGSTDDSVDILNAYKDRFYWVSEKDKGQTDAINKGMKLAKGEILAYLNSDDILLPGAISTIVDYFLKHNDCSMVYGNADYIDKNDGIIGPYKTDKYSFHRLMQDCMVCQPAAFWKKSVIHKIGLFDDSLNFVMDYDYWIRIAKANLEIHFIEAKLACSRLYPETKTMTYRKKIYKEIFKTCEKHTGFVDIHFYYGYWHHLLNEAAIFGSLISKVPGIYKILGWIHHKLYFRSHSFINRISVLNRKFTRNYLISLFRKVLRKIGIEVFFIQILKMSIKRSNNVVGYYSDGWISNNLVLTISDKMTKEFKVGYLKCMPFVTGSLAVFNNNKLIKQVYYSSGSKLEIDFDIYKIVPGILYFNFSDFNYDRALRKLSAKLLSTNLFKESDL